LCHLSSFCSRVRSGWHFSEVSPDCDSVSLGIFRERERGVVFDPASVSDKAIAASSFYSVFCIAGPDSLRYLHLSRKACSTKIQDTVLICSMQAAVHFSSNLFDFPLCDSLVVASRRRDRFCARAARLLFFTWIQIFVA
jgi:hypothetical protein